MIMIRFLGLIKITLAVVRKMNSSGADCNSRIREMS